MPDLPNSKPAEDAPSRPGTHASAEIPSLTLHSSLGQMLFTGRKPKHGKQEIVGLLRFATQIRLIWKGASQDDPYAGWWMIKVDRALELAGQPARRG